MPRPHDEDVDVLEIPEAPEEIEVEETPELVEPPVEPEIEPVPKGFGGSFVKRGGKLYPRGSTGAARSSRKGVPHRSGTGGCR